MAKPVDFTTDGDGNLYIVTADGAILARFGADKSVSFPTIVTAQGVAEISGSGAPTDGVDGAGTVGLGGRYTDVAAGKLYINTGTLASPVWTVVGAQS